MKSFGPTLRVSLACLAVGAFSTGSGPTPATGCEFCRTSPVLNAEDPFAAVSLGPAGGFHIGLDFLTAPVDPGPSFLFDFEPFPLLAPGNNFVTQGAFAGRSESEIQRHIALAVEDAFRSIPGLPADSHPAISIHIGRVPQSAQGRRLNVALAQSSSPGWTLLGEALQNTYSPGSVPDDSYVAVAYLDEIDRLGDSHVTYDAYSGAINAIAGTLAHELGHVFGAEHVSITGNEPGPLPLMAIEATGLPTAARLTARQFDLLPQFTPPNATRVLNNAGTVLPVDFNLDGQLDAADIGVLMEGFGAPDSLFMEGDATGDHRVDAADIGQLFAAWPAGSPSAAFAQFAAGPVPEPSSQAIGLLFIARAIIRRRKMGSGRQAA